MYTNGLLEGWTPWINAWIYVYQLIRRGRHRYYLNNTNNTKHTKNTLNNTSQFVEYTGSKYEKYTDKCSWPVGRLAAEITNQPFSWNTSIAYIQINDLSKQRNIDVCREPKRHVTQLTWLLLKSGGEVGNLTHLHGVADGSADGIPCNISRPLVLRAL